MRRLREEHEKYLAGGVLTAISPVGDLSSIILALGGIVLILAASLFILGAYKRKKSSDKLQRRVSGIKRQLNDIKGEEIVRDDADWLKMKKDEDASEIQNQLGMNKK